MSIGAISWALARQSNMPTVTDRIVALKLSTELSMAFLGFRVRSANRDRDTDVLRLERLMASVAELEMQIQKEQSGLDARHEKAMANAAFSQQTLENTGDRFLSLKVDELTSALANYAQRSAALKDQQTFIESLGKSISAFAENHGSLARDQKLAGR